MVLQSDEPGEQPITVTMQESVLRDIISSASKIADRWGDHAALQFSSSAAMLEPRRAS